MNRSENGILFECQLDILTKRSNFKNKINYINDYYANDGKEVNNNFSHDNFTGIYCWAKRFGYPLKTLPLFGRHSLRPDNFLFYLWTRYPKIGFIFLPIISLSMIIGAYRVRRVNSRCQIEISTSGKILTYFKLKCFKMNKTKLIVDYIIKRDKDLQGWDKVFEIYHKEARPVIYKAFKEDYFGRG